jgi:hypothetical protein
MKNFLVLVIAILGLPAMAPTKSQAQGFTVTIGDAPGYYAPDYYGYRHYNYDPGNEYYYHHGRVYYPRSYHRRYYYGPDHRYYRWYQ